MGVMGRFAAWAAVVAMPAVSWALARTVGALWEARAAVVQVDDLVAMGAAGFGAAVAGYLAVTGWAMVFGALLRGGRSLPRSMAVLAPTSWQRITATALGLTVSAGIAAPALASPSTAPHVGWSEPAIAHTVGPEHTRRVASPAEWTTPAALTAPSSPPPNGGPLAVGFAAAPMARAAPGAARTAAPTGAATATPSPRTAPQSSSPANATAGPSAADAVPAASQTYTVVRGDSLWRISAKLLGPKASDASINRAWPTLYAANADAVGSDPALIHPGMVLSVPEGFGS